MLASGTELTEWTPIAVNRGGLWEPLLAAPLQLADARRLRDEGTLLMAQRRGKPDGRLQLVVKLATQKKGRR